MVKLSATTYLAKNIVFCHVSLGCLRHVIAHTCLSFGTCLNESRHVRPEELCLSLSERPGEIFYRNPAAVSIVNFCKLVNSGYEHSL